MYETNLAVDTTGEPVSTVYRDSDGHTDSQSGKWVDGSQEVGTIRGFIQPRSGAERPSETQTRYESDHIIFTEHIEFNEGFSELKKGDRVVAEDDREFIIEFIADWSSHYEIELIKR